MAQAGRRQRRAGRAAARDLDRQGRHRGAEPRRGHRRRDSGPGGRDGRGRDGARRDRRGGRSTRGSRRACGAAAAGDPGRRRHRCSRAALAGSLPRARRLRARRAAGARRGAARPGRRGRGGERERQEFRLARRRADRRPARHRPERYHRDGPGRPRHEEGHPCVHRVRRRRAAPRRGRSTRRRSGACRRARACDRRGRSRRRSPRGPARTSCAGSAGSGARPRGGSRRARRARSGSRACSACARSGRRTRGADDRDAPRRRRAHAPFARHLRARDERDRGRHVTGGRRPRPPQEGVPGVVRRQSDVPRVHLEGRRRDPRGMAVDQRRDARRQDRDADVREPRHRRRARGREGPDRAGDPQRPGSELARHGARHRGAGREGAHEEVDARRRPGRHVHDHEPGRISGPSMGRRSSASPRPASSARTRSSSARGSYRTSSART